jgi:asparagine synthase (glutamine-hydrolysing)
MALDFSSYLPGSVLTKVDRASMAHGLEVRPPLLHDPLIDWAFSLPSSLKYHRGTSKLLLKMAVDSDLPHDVIHRRKKGFAIPLARWLKGPLRPRLESILHHSPIWSLDVLKQETFQRWFDEHLNLAADRSRPLWALLVLDHWCRRIRPLAPRAGEDAQTGCAVAAN